MRPTVATVDLGAIAHNVAALAERAGDAIFCAVVKADAYGHGAVASARTAVEAGAQWLAVALVEEGVELRRAGLDVPILLLSEPRPPEMIEVVEHDLRPTVYSGEGFAAAAAAAAGRGERLAVHLKVDTGMHRVGARPEDVAMLARAIVDKPALDLEGLWTHCALADEPERDTTDRQIDLFDAVLAELADEGIVPPITHVGNSAVLLAHPRGLRDLVRVGIAVYGLPPVRGFDGGVDLQPAMRLTSAVSMVKVVAAGEGVSYGLRHTFSRDTVVATVPIGYADGVRRSYSRFGGQVLIRGRRRPVVGVVTMDQLMVDCGPPGDPAADAVATADEVVLIGEQDGETIGAVDVAEVLGSIAYEVVCDVGRRVRRVYR
ncbi:MAG: alanine racemase [Acidimicrobiales bacterium]